MRAIAVAIGVGADDREDAPAQLVQRLLRGPGCQPKDHDRGQCVASA